MSLKLASPDDCSSHRQVQFADPAKDASTAGHVEVFLEGVHTIMSNYSFAHGK